MIPDSTRRTIDNYVEKKWRPGGFVRSVLANDLKGALGRADMENRRAIFAIVSYVVQEIPANCHGSYEIVDRWLKND